MTRWSGTLTGLALLVLLTLPPEAGAQGVSLDLEVRGGLTAPTGEFDAAVGSPGAGSDATLQASLLAELLDGNVLVYAGWRRDAFEPRNLKAELESILSSGPALGVRAALPLGETGAIPWVQVGATLARVRVEGLGPEGEYDREATYEVGFGFDVPLTEGTWLSPALVYHRTGVDVRLSAPGFILYTAEPTYFTFELGIRRRVF